MIIQLAKGVLTMDAITQMAAALGAIPRTPQERRAAKNRRYYARCRDRALWYEEVKKLRRLRDLLLSSCTEPVSLRQLLRNTHADH